MNSFLYVLTTNQKGDRNKYEVRLSCFPEGATFHLKSELSSTAGLIQKVDTLNASGSFHFFPKLVNRKLKLPKQLIFNA